MSFSLVLHHYDIPLARPYIWSKGIHHRKWSIIVEVQVAEGYGFGEIAYDPAWEQLDEGDFEKISAGVRQWYGSYSDVLLKGVLAGDMVSVSALLDHLEGVGGRVRCGVSSAVIQALANLHRTSMHRLLSAQQRTEIPINCLVSLREGEDVNSAGVRLVQEIESYTRYGVSTVKCKGTAEVSYDISVLRVLTAAFPKCSFRLDPNGGWSAEEVIGNCDQLNDLCLEYVEEPFSNAFDYNALLENGVRIPVAFDHWGAEEHDLVKLVERYTPVAVVIKCQAVGGPDKGASIAQLAERMGIRAVVTGSLETLVGLSVAAEVAACTTDISAAGIVLWDYFRPNSHPVPLICGGMVPLPLVKNNPDFPDSWLVRSSRIC